MKPGPKFLVSALSSTILELVNIQETTAQNPAHQGSTSLPHPSARAPGRLKKGTRREQIKQDLTTGWETLGRGHGIRPDDPEDELRSLAPASPSEWIGEIQRQFAQGRSATLELAITVSTAKSRLHHGEWTAILKSGRLPFRKRRAEMLVVIGNGLGWLSAHDRAHLPSAFRTLYCLAGIERAALQVSIADGAIHPGLTLRDAEQLVARFGGQAKEQTQKVNVKRRLQRFGDFVRATVSDWQPEERELANRELSRLIEEINDAAGVGFEHESSGGRHCPLSGRRIFLTPRATSVNSTRQSEIPA